MNYAEVNAQLRAEHRITVGWLPGGYKWFCSCGRQATTGSGYASQAQALARGDRHLLGARRRIERAA